MAAPPQVFAHRGCRLACPENTLAAFDRAVDIGAHGLELDVRLTLDGVPVILHDPTLDRTTDGAGPVAEMSWEAVCQLDAGRWHGEGFSGERVPSLEQTLTAVEGLARLNVHLKPEDDPERLVGAVVRVLREHNARESADLSAPLEMLQIARGLEPRLRGCYLGAPPRGEPAYLEVTRARHCQIVQVAWEQLSAPYLARSRDLGVEVHAMHMEGGGRTAEQVAERLAGLPLDAVLTDFPEEWVERVRRGW